MVGDESYRSQTIARYAALYVLPLFMQVCGSILLGTERKENSERVLVSVVAKSYDTIVSQTKGSGKSIFSFFETLLRRKLFISSSVCMFKVVLKYMFIFMKM